MGQAPPRPRNVEKVLGKNPFIFRFHVTLQGTNGSHPENRVSQKETYIQTIHFQVRTVSFRECKFQSCSRGLLRSKQETPPPQQSWRKSVVDSHPTMPERRSLGNRLFLEQIGLEGIYFQLCYWSANLQGWNNTRRPAKEQAYRTPRVAVLLSAGGHGCWLIAFCKTCDVCFTVPESTRW